jgi:hypothetical protein
MQSTMLLPLAFYRPHSTHTQILYKKLLNNFNSLTLNPNSENISIKAELQLKSYKSLISQLHLKTSKSLIHSSPFQIQINSTNLNKIQHNLNKKNKSIKYKIIAYKSTQNLSSSLISRVLTENKQIIQNEEE